MASITRVAAITGIILLAACSDSSNDNNTEEAQDGAMQPVETPEAKDTLSMTEAYALENQQYLETNQAKDGVEVTESGLQYEILNKGDGESPSADGFVTVHYRGKFIDGREFDSSHARGEPATFPVGGLIPGFTEALLLMQEGDTFQVTIPSDLAYGENGAGGGVIPGNSTLVFELELIEALTKQEADELQQRRIAEAEAQAEAFKATQTEYLEKNAGNEGITVTDSGLQYRVIEEGEGAKPTNLSKVTVHYSGKLTNGEEFDSSYRRGQPASFPLNGVIKGWTEGLQLMSEGSKYEFFIPFDLGYGERGSGSGSIPPFATLIFTVELISVDSRPAE